MEKKNFEKVLFVMLAIFALVGLMQGTVVNAKEGIEVTITSEKEFIKAIYDNLLVRNTEFTIGYNGSWGDIYKGDLDEVFQKVFRIDDKETSDDFDYLKGNVKMYRLSASGNSKHSKFTFVVEYRETAGQLAKVNDYVSSTLEDLNLDGKSTYQKVKAIHNHIINNTKYDKTYKKYSAYNAINGSAVCQGYSLLFYKMAIEAGVPCRCVTSDNHAWNIVKLGKKWYHIDVTWDDPISSKPMLVYTYFLFGSKQVDKTHTLSDEFTTAAFKKAYPISKVKYKR